MDYIFDRKTDETLTLLLHFDKSISLFFDDNPGIDYEHFYQNYVRIRSRDIPSDALIRTIASIIGLDHEFEFDKYCENMSNLVCHYEEGHLSNTDVLEQFKTIQEKIIKSREPVLSD